ncbi:hypothetical protein RUND412_003467 [Rhizina undulata]
MGNSQVGFAGIIRYRKSHTTRVPFSPGGPKPVTVTVTEKEIDSSQRTQQQPEVFTQLSGGETPTTSVILPGKFMKRQTEFLTTATSAPGFSSVDAAATCDEGWGGNNWVPGKAKNSRSIKLNEHLSHQTVLGPVERVRLPQEEVKMPWKTQSMFDVAEPMPAATASSTDIVAEKRDYWMTLEKTMIVARAPGLEDLDLPLFDAKPPDLDGDVEAQTTNSIYIAVLMVIAVALGYVFALLIWLVGDRVWTRCCGRWKRNNDRREKFWNIKIGESAGLSHGNTTVTTNTGSSGFGFGFGSLRNVTSIGRWHAQRLDGDIDNPGRTEEGLFAERAEIDGGNLQRGRAKSTGSESWESIIARRGGNLRNTV